MRKGVSEKRRPFSYCGNADYAIRNWEWCQTALQVRRGVACDARKTPGVMRSGVIPRFDRPLVSSEIIHQSEAEAHFLALEREGTPDCE